MVATCAVPSHSPCSFEFVRHEQEIATNCLARRITVLFKTETAKSELEDDYLFGRMGIDSEILKRDISHLVVWGIGLQYEVVWELVVKRFDIYYCVDKDSRQYTLLYSELYQVLALHPVLAFALNG